MTTIVIILPLIFHKVTMIECSYRNLVGSIESSQYKGSGLLN